MIEDLNLLYKAFKDSKKNSNWKPEVQKFEMNWLTELALLQKDLSDKTYKTSNNTEFIINERGKTRRITGNKMRDRVVRHVFCDNVLYPNIEKYLIYDNGASRKGKGISFTRNRLLKHLRNYYHHFGNDGYILLMDFSKYYDNIRHDIIKNQFKDKIDEKYLWLFDLILKDFEVDVSYMTDDEFLNCLNTKFNSLDHPICHEGEKYMSKSVNIGDQCSQIFGISYTTPIDNFIKIVKGIKYYGRYMDDSYIISSDKNFLISLLKEIKEQADKLGIFINNQKTQIYKLST
ncbi:reverse transcriptase domain-containing protein, partial [Methanobrevibacter sp.]